MAGNEVQKVRGTQTTRTAGGLGESGSFSPNDMGTHWKVLEEALPVASWWSCGTQVAGLKGTSGKPSWETTAVTQGDMTAAALVKEGDGGGRIPGTF